MNDRIEELRNQASSYAYRLHPEEDSYGRPVNPDKFQRDRDTEFAELIVRECIRKIEDIAESSNNPQPIYRVSVELLEHFGVE